MSPLAGLEFYREAAADGMTNFAQELQIVLREQCAAPEIAGGAVADFLEHLPSCKAQGPSAPLIDACYAERILHDTLRALEALTREERHMQRMLDEVHQEEVDVRASANDDGDLSLLELDEHISRETAGDQAAIDEAIRNAGRASDAEIIDSFQSTFEHRGEGELNFSRLSPDLCYRNATRALIEGILRACAGADERTKPRLLPLVDAGVLINRQIDQTFAYIHDLASQLKFDGSGVVDASADDF